MEDAFKAVMSMLGRVFGFVLFPYVLGLIFFAILALSDGMDKRVQRLFGLSMFLLFFSPLVVFGGMQDKSLPMQIVGWVLLAGGYGIAIYLGVQWYKSR